MYSVQSTVYSEECTLYNVHCTVYIVQCTVYSVQCITNRPGDVPQNGDDHHGHYVDGRGECTEPGGDMLTVQSFNISEECSLKCV